MTFLFQTKHKRTSYRGLTATKATDSQAGRIALVTHSPLNCEKFHSPTLSLGWLRGSAVEHWSLVSELSLSCARPVAEG